MNRPVVDWNSPAKTSGVVRFGGDEDLVVTFYWRSMQDMEKSRANAVPIYEDKRYVKIFRPGEMQNIVDRPVTQEDIARFPRQWQQFVDKQAQVPEGSPLELLFPNNPAVADSLRARGVYTIQQLAHLTAHAIETIGMGAQSYVNKAKEYIEAAKSGEAFIKAQAKIEDLEQKLGTATRLLKEQKEQIDILMKKVLSLDETNKKDQFGNPIIGHVAGYDPQTERINSTHVTKDIAKNNKPKAKSKPVVDDDEEDQE